MIYFAHFFTFEENLIAFNYFNSACITKKSAYNKSQKDK